jgi:5-methylthioadenosine/S-adenosylhomocysteine deaminase
MTRTLIRNVDIITLDEQGTVLRGSQIAIRDRTIVGVDQLPPGFEPQETIEATNHVAIPALFNAHCHAAMTFERGWAEDLSFPRWLNEKIWVAESVLSPEDVYWGAALAAVEMIRGGVSGFNDHYFYMDQVARVVEQSGMKASLAWCVFGIGDEKEIGANLEGSLDFIDRWTGRGDGRLHLFLGPHSPYICPSSFLARVADLAQARRLGIHLHVAESQEQVDKSLREFGRTPVEHLETLGVLDAPGGCLAAHCLVVSDQDLDILARHGTTVPHAPVTYMKLAMGVNNLARFLAKGVRLAVGTDGPASNGDLDMLAALRQMAILQKHEQRDPRALPGDLALRLATRNGAQAAGFIDTGVISCGAAADIALIDMDRPHLLPRHDLVANVVHCARAADVTDLMVEGRWLYRHGELLTLDEEKIKAEAEQRALRLVQRGMHQVREYRG